MMLVTAMITQRHRDPRAVAAAAREVALRGPGVAGLLGQPAEPAGDLGLVLGRRPAVGLAVGVDRAVQVAVADARRRDVPPGRRRSRASRGSSRTAVQRRDRLGLVVEPVVRLAEPEQGRRRDRRVVEADDAIEVPAGVGEIAGGEQLAATLEQRQRRVTGQSTARARVERCGRRRGVVHRPDDTRLAGMCGRFTQQRPASELAEIFGAEPLIDDPGERYNVAPTDEAAVVVQREDRRAVTGLPLGPDPALGEGGQGRLAHVQRPGRDDHHQPGLPRRVRAQALPRPGRFVLRVEARGHGPPAVPGGPPRRRAARPRRACGRAGATRRPRRSGGRSRSSPRPRTRRWPTCTTGCRSSSTPTPGIAGSIRHRPTPASSSACWSRTRTSSSMSTRSSASSTTSGATAPS